MWAVMPIRASAVAATTPWADRAGFLIEAFSRVSEGRSFLCGVVPDLAAGATSCKRELMPRICIDTQFGRLCVEECDGAIVRLTWGGEEDAPDAPLLREAASQLQAYDQRRLQQFDLPLRVGGSDFQRKVCDAMLSIPFGETRTYGHIASELGYSAQAVGQGCGANPIPVIIPCHRVLGANGLGGFSGGGGIETKVALLRHEGAAGLLI